MEFTPLTKHEVLLAKEINETARYRILASLETVNRMAKQGKYWTTASAKISKTNKDGIVNIAMFLAPADKVASESHTLCFWAKENKCKANCIAEQGRLGMPQGQFAQLWKTAALLLRPEWFRSRVVKELKDLVKKHGAENLRVRPDGTSDLLWDWLVEMFPDVKFYGYTKGIKKIQRNRHKNLSLTFSGSNANSIVRLRTAQAIKMGMNVALALNTGKTKDEWTPPSNHHRLLDMDKQDDRTQDPVGAIGLLKRKGSNKATRLAEEGHGHSFFFTQTQLNNLLLETLI
jgi:hypothetical protein